MSANVFVKIKIPKTEPVYYTRKANTADTQSWLAGDYALKNNPLWLASATALLQLSQYSTKKKVNINQEHADKCGHSHLY